MSTQEKSIYKQIVVPGNQSQVAIPESRAYRGISTVDPDATTLTYKQIAYLH